MKSTIVKRRPVIPNIGDEVFIVYYVTHPLDNDYSFSVCPKIKKTTIVHIYVNDSGITINRYENIAGIFYNLDNAYEFCKKLLNESYKEKEKYLKDILEKELNNLNETYKGYADES